MKARVFVTLKSGVLDPQGKAIEGVLSALGIEGVGSVRQGKVFDLDIDAADEAGATDLLKRACERLLANTVIENYRFELTDGAPTAAPADPATEDGFAPDEAVDEGTTDPAQSAAEHAEMPAEGHP